MIITNDHNTPGKALIKRHTRGMTIEQRLAELIRAFCLDALSSTVNLYVDLDVVLCVLAQALTASFRARLGTPTPPSPRRPPTPLTVPQPPAVTSSPSITR